MFKIFHTECHIKNENMGKKGYKKANKGKISVTYVIWNTYEFYLILLNIQWISVNFPT